MSVNKEGKSYKCWLNYEKITDNKIIKNYNGIIHNIIIDSNSPVISSVCEELKKGIKGMLGFCPHFYNGTEENIKSISQNLLIAVKFEKLSGLNNILNNKEVKLIKDNLKNKDIGREGFIIKFLENNGSRKIIITAESDTGVLYGIFNFLRKIKLKIKPEDLDTISSPENSIRMINHWDNLDGSIERGYAGNSIFYKDNKLRKDLERVKDYARLLSSVGINSISINNVNVHDEESKLLTSRLGMVKTLADIFRSYGIKTFLSINYASPIELGNLDTADPLDEGVKKWWAAKTKEVYNQIPDFGGFIVKADSEHRPGPFSYDRNHAEGANMLAEALEPFGGFLIWRCFVYNCQQDWRDYLTDRARAAYDNFKPLDGEFKDNVILQIKNGPMDFQVREPVSPLFGAMPETNQILELQITQEYTGQQRHLCYLIPQWKEVLEFDTYSSAEGSKVKRIVDGSLFNQKNTGFAGVVNVGDDENWTGHRLAQANLYGYGRLAWNPDLKSEKITDEWIKLSFGDDSLIVENITQMLLNSWEIYEKYTSPLGIGWMVNPNHHYGPNVDGYEYSRWGTYHRADHFGIGVDRTVKTGTGYTSQYFKENAEMYESLEKCPDELILFFHHVPYTYKLQSTKTVIQHIYDTHFEGVEKVYELKSRWVELKGKIDDKSYEEVLERLKHQMEHAKEWRDIINSYFYRKSAINDEKNRKIY